MLEGSAQYQDETLFKPYGVTYKRYDNQKANQTRMARIKKAAAICVSSRIELVDYSVQPASIKPNITSSYIIKASYLVHGQSLVPLKQAINRVNPLLWVKNNLQCPEFTLVPLQRACILRRQTEIKMNAESATFQSQERVQSSFIWSSFISWRKSLRNRRSYKRSCIAELPIYNAWVTHTIGNGRPYHKILVKMGAHVPSPGPTLQCMSLRQRIPSISCGNSATGPNGYYPRLYIFQVLDKSCRD